MYRILMVAPIYQEDTEAKKSRKKNAGNVAQSQLDDSLSIKDIVGNYRSVQVSGRTYTSSWQYQISVKKSRHMYIVHIVQYPI